MAIANVQEFVEDGTCSFCRREGKEGVLCVFADGSFSGFLCKADFWRFLRLHADHSGDEPRPRASATGGLEAVGSAANGRAS